MTINYNGAVEAVRERMDYATPESEVSAVEEAREALAEYVDAGLVYTRDILELWDGTTHDAVDLTDGYDDIMHAITISVFWQMMEELEDAIYDGIDSWITSELDRLGLTDEFEDCDRDGQSEAIHDAR